ncbi:hypothetical protein FB446DRAFT_471557 [Lentinula raphanica]|nr:hypothetical protein FB446DRAFT_471557 [Lentinula raphanica]
MKLLVPATFLSLIWIIAPFYVDCTPLRFPTFNSDPAPVSNDHHGAFLFDSVPLTQFKKTSSMTVPPMNGLSLALLRTSAPLERNQGGGMIDAIRQKFKKRPRIGENPSTEKVAICVHMDCFTAVIDPLNINPTTHRITLTFQLFQIPPDKQIKAEVKKRTMTVVPLNAKLDWGDEEGKKRYIKKIEEITSRTGRMLEFLNDMVEMMLADKKLYESGASGAAELTEVPLWEEYYRKAVTSVDEAPEVPVKEAPGVIGAARL